MANRVILPTGPLHNVAQSGDLVAFTREMEQLFDNRPTKYWKFGLKPTNTAGGDPLMDAMLFSDSEFIFLSDSTTVLESN